MRFDETGLALNTGARVTIEGGTNPPLFLVEAPVKGDAWRSHRVDQQSFPDAHTFLISALTDAPSGLDASADALSELQRIGLLVPVRDMSAPVHYDLGGSTHPVDNNHAVDEIRAKAHSGSPIFENGFRIPEDWRAGPLSFVPHRPGGVFGPVRRTPDHSGAIPALPEFDSPEQIAEFSDNGFVSMPDLLPASHVRELARYYRALAAEGWLIRHDDRGTHRFIAHNHPVANFWHDQINARVSHLAGRATKPSYTFVSLYEAGGDLDWHTDRPPCEYTITVLLDYAPLRDDGRSPWPLRIRGRDHREHVIEQRIGDALIFRGRELEHSRPVLPEGHTSSSLLFHFVHGDYSGVMS